MASVDPYSESMPSGAETMFTVLTGGPMIVVFVIALVLVRRGQPLLLLCFIGGGLASSFEPVADVLCQLYFPAEGQETAFTALDRPIPYALVFAYPWYVGGQGYLTYRMLERGMPVKRLWQLWGLFALSDVAVETPGVLTDFHTYYGNQPLEFWGFPLWMAAMQAVMPMAAGALVLLVRRNTTTTWGLLLVVPLIPMADALVNAGIGLPMWLALGSDLSLGATYVAAAMTIGCAAVAVWVLSVLVCRPAPPPDEPDEQSGRDASGAGSLVPNRR